LHDRVLINILNIIVWLSRKSKR